MNKNILLVSIIATLGTQLYATSTEHHTTQVANKVIAEQRATLAKNTKDKGFGPQSPRDIDTIKVVNLQNMRAMVMDMATKAVMCIPEV